LVQRFVHHVRPWPRTVEEDCDALLIQGASLQTAEELMRRAQMLLQREGEENAWPLGPFRLPHRLLYNHVLYVGTTGSGKTTFINQLKRNALARIRPGSGHRACIWDFKSEELQYLAGLKLCDADGRATGPCKVHYLNPADARGVALDIARDVVNEFEADQFAKDVIAPGAKVAGERSVWIEAARNCVSQVIKTFQEMCGVKWQFIDVVEACFYSKKLKAILSLTREGRATLRDSFGTRNQALGVFFTIQSFAKALRPAAAAMANKAKARPGISLTDWVTGEESILVIGNHPVLKDVLAPLQRWVFGHVVRTLLVQDQTQTKRCLFFLDEVRQAPFGEVLGELATTGRSKGAAMVAGLQDKEGLTETLGEANAKEFVGMFDTLVFLRTKSVETREWASQYYGKHLRTIADVSESKNLNEGSGPGGPTSGRGKDDGRSYHETERTLVYANEFRTLPSPRQVDGHGLVAEAYVSIPFVGEGHVITGGMEKRSIDPERTVPNHRPVSNEDLTFRWDVTRLTTLGLPTRIHTQLLDEDALDESTGQDAEPMAGHEGEIDVEELIAQLDSDSVSMQRRQAGPGMVTRGGWEY
jgi:hypothetical protein